MERNLRKTSVWNDCTVVENSKDSDMNYKTTQYIIITNTHKIKTGHLIDLKWLLLDICLFELIDGDRSIMT